MNLAVRAPFVLYLVGCALSLAGCTGVARVLSPDHAQIRERIATIRAAILTKDVEGIFRWGTPDWSFTAPDGRVYDRTAYRERTTKLFAAVEIESLETDVRQVHVDGVHADVWLQQTMVRTETDASGTRTRWRVTYGEDQEWVRVSDGWRVVGVKVIGMKRDKVPVESGSGK